VSDLRFRAFFAALLAAPLLTWTAAGWAQQNQDGPLRLLPGQAKQEDAAPAASPPAAATAPRRDDEGVAVVQLEQVDPSSVGLLTPENGGFGVDLWAGSRRELIERLLPRLPERTPSRTAQSLRRRLLLTAAHVPPGAAIAPSFLGLRVERQAATGGYTEALALAALASPQIDDPALEIVHVDGALLAGDHQTACAVVDAALQKGRRDSYWVRALTFCRLLDGDTERARLTASILRELPGETDELFHQLVAALADGADIQIDDVTEPTPLHIAMIRAARRAIPDGAALSTRPAILRAVATSPNASIEARLVAAEAAEIVGALSAESLGQIYASLAFSDEQRTNALSEAQRMSGARAHALLYQTAATEQIASAQAEALRIAFALANPKAHGMLARVNQDRLAALTPTADLMWFAHHAGLAQLHAGSVQQARAWFDLARLAVSDSQPDAALAVLRLWPALLIAQAPEEMPWVPEAVGEWWNGVAALDDGSAPSFGGSALSLLEAVGLDPPEEAWAGYLDLVTSEQVQRPSIAVLRGLRAAGERGRTGEGVAFALVALGDAHPSEIDLSTAALIVSTLVRLGLDDDARGIALEAIVGRSL